MKLKHLYEYNLKTQDFPNTKQYEYIETENYIFLKLDKRQMYKIYDFHGVLSAKEANNYLNNMVVPSKINKDTLIDFFDNNHEYFTRLKRSNNEAIFNFNNLKTIFNKNYMGYSDWDICTSDIDLEYEMKHVLFNNVRGPYYHDTAVIFQAISFINTSAVTSKNEEAELYVESKKYQLSDNKMKYDYFGSDFIIAFIVRKK